MIQNTDPKIVVMDRDEFNRLWSYAMIGHEEAGGNDPDWVNHAKRHVRRFNKPIQEAAALRRKHKQLEAIARKAAIKAVIRKGNVVWWIPQQVSNETYYTQARAIGVTEDGHHLQMRHVVAKRDGQVINSYCDPSELLEQLPPHYQRLAAGTYKDWYAYSKPCEYELELPQ
jgi:hypothetical protein